MSLGWKPFKISEKERFKRLVDYFRNMNAHQQITDTVSKLFIYTDEKNWNNLRNEVLAPKVFLDMSSLGGPAGESTVLFTTRNL